MRKPGGRCPVDGVAVAGHTKAPSKKSMDPKKMMRADAGGTIMNYKHGGYVGGMSGSGRGTMAGELGRKGDMSVREAGETMYELSKRRRGMDAGGGVGAAGGSPPSPPEKRTPSSYNRPYNQKNK